MLSYTNFVELFLELRLDSKGTTHESGDESVKLVEDTRIAIFKTGQACSHGGDPVEVVETGLAHPIFATL
jgi:hypothetical protein